MIILDRLFQQLHLAGSMSDDLIQHLYIAAKLRERDGGHQQERFLDKLLAKEHGSRTTLPARKRMQFIGGTDDREVPHAVLFKGKICVKFVGGKLLDLRHQRAIAGKDGKKLLQGRSAGDVRLFHRSIHDLGLFIHDPYGDAAAVCDPCDRIAKYTRHFYPPPRLYHI